MSKKTKIAIVGIPVAGLIGLAAWYLHRVNIPVLQPHGLIGEKERNLMLFTVLLGLVIIVPVFTMAIVIAWRYRESNIKTHHKYAPDWDRNRALEFTWWAIPIVIITILSVVTWTSTYQLDPWKPLASTTKPLTIQVISLDWKWLFIYPQQHIATVNFVQFPTNTPVNFKITSDSVMNSFWIPQLGGQIYSMPGMSTQLHLMADRAGDYAGSSANISGKGFAGMKFTAHATSLVDFNKWLDQTQHSMQTLTQTAYDQLAKPSENDAMAFYGSVRPDLYDSIVMKYMGHEHVEGGPPMMHSMNMGTN